MSHEGKIARGKHWWSFRDTNQILPLEIKNDPGKMCDVNYYLDNIKPKAVEAIPADKPIKKNYFRRKK